MSMPKEEIVELIRGLLEKMQMPAEAIEVADEGGKVFVKVRSRDSHLLIGARGAHLFALNHLVRKMVAKTDRLPAGRHGETDFLIDVNDYQKEALLHLQTTAQIMGERARSFKTSIELEPMSAFERMTVHSFFEGAADLTTESVGAGDNRRVIIKYREPSA